MLRTRELIPPLTMRLPDGHTIRAWDFKHKKSLVIVFLDANCGACEGFLKNLAEYAAALRAKDAVVLVAFLEAPSRRLTDTLAEGVSAGTDVSGRAARAFLGDDALSSAGLKQPGVFVTDRYGELAAQWMATAHAFPAVGEILACLGQIEIVCEECGPPDWNATP
jgi:AhpC/TSA family